MEEQVKEKKILSEETRQKMRLAKLRNPVRYWLGKKKEPMAQELRQKISTTMKGRKFTDEHRKHLQEARVRYCQKKKETLQNEVNNNIINNNLS